MFWRHTLNTAGASLLAFMVVLIWTNRDGAPLALGAAFIAFAVANLDVIKRFKASMSGVEAETREIIRDAKDTLRELRSLAKEFATIFIIMVNAEGRWGGGLNVKRKAYMTETILSHLRDLGLEDRAIEDVRSMERPFVLFDYASLIAKTVDRSNFTQEQHQEWNKFFEDVKRAGIGHEASPDELEGFLRSLDPDLLTNERRELIEDYRFYKANMRHRRPEIWERRREWGRPR